MSPAARNIALSAIRFLLISMPPTMGSSAAWAADIDRELIERINGGEYSRRGADTCIGCHDETYPFPTVAIFGTKHGARHEGSPFAAPDDAAPPAGLQCEACHGPAGRHIRQILPEGETRAPIIGFGPDAAAAAYIQDSMCLACHEDHERRTWRGSAHERAEVPCSGCHGLHAGEDPVLERAGQVETCTGCHRHLQADILSRSAHPLRFGQLVCSDCHQPHGASSEFDLIERDVNSTCFTCHAEKQGPFLFEHQPAAEDCSICHRPHGSNQPALLARRAPQLCQGCHSAAGHRNLPQSPVGLPPAGASEYLLAGACLNCHTEVHGSNHPSGDKLRK